MATTYAARCIFPVSTPPLVGGTVTVGRGAILGVDRPGRQAPDVDLGEMALLPGLINAHTHLEFSHLDAPLGRPQMPLADWLRQVIADRHQRDAPPAAPQPAATARGLREALETGTTRLAEIATGQTPWPPVEQRPALHVLDELRGLSDERIEAAMGLLDQIPARPRLPLLAPGASPHAPYSAHPRLIQAAAQWAAAHRATLAMHLAESPDEREFLQAGSGPLRRLLEDLQVWRPEAFRGHFGFGHYLQWLSAAPRSLVIHGNYLREEEWDLLAERRDRMTLVYCGRTHAYFGHAPYPLAELQQRGVRVALGTDSRASNPDLSLWDEWRAVAARHPDVAPGEVLAMATRNGAEALGVQGREGILRAGCAANLVAVRLPARPAGDPYQWLLDPQAAIAGVMLRGTWIVSPDPLAENRSLG